MKHPLVQTGFTLIELLMVVAIIAILATIALPNFLEAQTRSKTARVKADLRALATALEAYAADNNCYPPVPILLPPRFRRFRPLTTPIAYMSIVPRDPFKSIDTSPEAPQNWRQGLYGYGATPLDNASRWALTSDGPDRQSDCSPLATYPGYSADLFAGRIPLYSYTLYDPTNGTVSRGDLFRANDFNP